MKRTFKILVLGVFYLLALPSGLLASGAWRLFRVSAVFDFFAQAWSLVPGLPGTWLRAGFYKQTLSASSMDLDIGFGSLISKIETRIGRGVLVTGHSTIGLSTIGDGTVVANYVALLSGRYQHNFTDAGQGILDRTDRFVRIHVGAAAFIGDHSVVMADVGSHTVVGAGSVVTSSLPDYVVAVGCPAKVVKQREQPANGN